MVVVKVEISVVGFGACVLDLAAVLPGEVCKTSRVDVPIMVAGVFCVVDVASVVFTEGWNVLSEALVVSLAVTAVKLPDG